ncbi:MAG TPA: hypothetical protein VFB62_05510 [Polyangiaceae bacterium]|nr:hypothetical protein [Polyangiaceae bacterium]
MIAVATGCGPSTGEDANDMEEHDHAEVSYEKVFRPVVESMAESSVFGAGIKVGFDAATEFARTDFAHNTCLDSPEAWGLELSVGGDIGIGYNMGVELSFHDGAISMNCLSQLELSPQAQIGARANLIRHFGECHGAGSENLEDTLFLELAAGVDTSLGVSLGVGVAYTAGLRKGLFNRTLPAYLAGTFQNWTDVVDAIVTGEPVFRAPETDEDHEALCESTHEVFDDHILTGGDEVHAEKLNGFLKEYLESNTHCEGAVGEIVNHADHGSGEHHHDEHDLHGWTVCTELTLKNALGAIRGEVAHRKESASGLKRNALTQLELTVALLDDVFSGCDHIEFQFDAGYGVATPATVTLGIESHNYYGTLSFDGSDEELGAALAQILDENTFRDPDQQTGWGSWALSTVCSAMEPLPVFGVFSVLPTGALCEMIKFSRATLGLVEAMHNDPRFQAEFASTLDLWGISLPLPETPFLNYAVNCGLGPARNALELLWY